MHQRRQSSHFPNRKRTYPGLAIFVFAFWSARAPGISRLALKTLLPRVDIRPASAPKRKRPRLFRVTGRPVEQCSPRSLLTTPYVPMCTGGMALMGEAKRTWPSFRVAGSRTGQTIGLSVVLTPSVGDREIERPGISIPFTFKSEILG